MIEPYITCEAIAYQQIAGLFRCTSKGKATVFFRMSVVQTHHLVPPSSSIKAPQKLVCDD